MNSYNGYNQNNYWNNQMQQQPSYIQPGYPIQQGYPQPQNSKNKPGCLKMFIILFVCIFIFLFMLGIIGSFLPEHDNINKNVYQDSTYVTVKNENLADKVFEHPKGKMWSYDEYVDEMTDKKDYYASLKSDNSHEFDFPYEGGSYGKITIRKSHQYGLDVYFNVTKGQLLCNEYNGTNYVTVRFDNKPAKKYYTTSAADGSSDILFLGNVKDFIYNAKKAKEIKIQVPVYNEGNPVFEFTVDSLLVWNH